MIDRARRPLDEVLARTQAALERGGGRTQGRGVEDEASRLEARLRELDEGLRAEDERRTTPWYRDGDLVWCETVRRDGTRVGCTAYLTEVQGG